MRRTASPEQRQAAEQRRARMRTLAREIAAMTEPDRRALAARSPVVTIEGHPLSLHNTCMVVSQMPTATVVGGFQQWRRGGRLVRKGEHGAAIWIPLRPTKTEEPEEETDGERDSSRLRFALTTVFDVTQTEEVPSV